MESQTLAVVLASIPPTLFALASFIASLRNRSTLQRVEVSVDGRLKELLAVTRTAAFAQGVKQEFESPTLPPLSDRSVPETPAILPGQPTKQP